ncbi:MAG: hypothetical protein ACRELX_06195 [Longimicrobiales bacterium]
MFAEPLYIRHAAAADRGAWSVQRDVRWQDIDREKAYARPAILQALRDATLIESYHAVHLAGLLASTRDDIDAGVAFSLELYEGFKHFHALRLYLEAIGYEPRITDEELVGIRQQPDEPTADTVIERLVDFMLSEHLAAYFFRRLGEQAADPVLAELLELIAADEVRHAQSASDLIAKRIAADRSLVTRVLDAAVNFRHYGERAVGTVPVAQPGDPLAIRTFARRIERLCGVRLVDHLKARI